jgi:hypothetical protein
LVAHNVTSATRLLDVLPLFRDDFRVQLLATATGSSPFRDGLADLLDAIGVPVLPWEQALRTPVDLAVSASFGGQLSEIAGRLAVLSHGMGYNKRLTSGERRTANGERRTANGERRTANGERPAASGQRPAATSSGWHPSGFSTTECPTRTPSCSPIPSRSPA